MRSISTKGSVVEGEKIDAHVGWLLDQLEPHTAALRGLVADGCHADFFIGYSMTESTPAGRFPQELVNAPATPA
jgi:hypothetical protein